MHIPNIPGSGVLPSSRYFFFSPVDVFREYFYYILNCGVFHCDHGYHVKRTGYISPLMVYLIKGQLFLNYESMSYTVGEEEIMLINCNNPHEYYCDEYCEFLYFHFDGGNSHQITNSLISRNGGTVFRLNDSLSVKSYMSQIIDRLDQNDYPNDAEMSCAVYSTLCSMQVESEKKNCASFSTNSILENVIGFIKSNISEDFTLDMLSRKANLSKFYFTRLFKTEVGFTPMEYISHLRMNLAKTNLKNTTRTVTDIAISLGYSSCSSFVSAFTTNIGISPQKYRILSSSAIVS